VALYLPSNYNVLGIQGSNVRKGTEGGRLLRVIEKRRGARKLLLKVLAFEGLRQSQRMGLAKGPVAALQRLWYRLTSDLEVRR